MGIESNSGVKIVILRGVPGSGKSTLAKKLEETFGFTRISSDELGLKAWRAPLQEAIERGDNLIVLDRCHSTHRQRMLTVRTIAPYKDKIRTFITTLPGVPFQDLERRIKSDVGHKYGISERLIDLRTHSKDRQDDKISMNKEGWTDFVRLSGTDLSELEESFDIVGLSEALRSW